MSTSPDVAESTPPEPMGSPEPKGSPAPMNHRQVLEALSGLLLGLFVTMLSSTVVSTSLPKIVSDLGGSQSSYTWVVTASLLAMTVSTPIWGKLADLTSRKLLIQIALIVFVVSSAVAGLSQNVEMLIGVRAVQGLGIGGMMALVQVAIADLISPRDRGRYMGILGGVMGVAQVGGPLLGGFITDSLGWHYNFYVGVPFAVVAIVLLQKTLHLPTVRRQVRIDYLGAALIAVGVADLLIWVTLAGNQFAWGSATSWTMIVGGVVALALAIVVESRAAEPMIPLRLFRNRTVVLAVIASIAVGTVMIGTTVFLSQYMQIARGKTPTETGLLTIPMVVGLLIASTVIGQIITRTGRWKRWMVLGSLLLTAGLSLMSTIDYQTSFVQVGGFLLLVGLGVGMTMQNLVLAAQNSIPITDMGAGSSLIAFFRSLGGAAGVSLLGALLASRTSSAIADGLAKLGIPTQQMGGNGSVPDVNTLPGPVRTVVEQAYGDGVAELFLVVIPAAVVAVIAIALIREVPLGTKSGMEQTLAAESAPEGDEPVAAVPDPRRETAPAASVPAAEPASVSGTASVPGPASVPAAGPASEPVSTAASAAGADPAPLAAATANGRGVGAESSALEGVVRRSDGQPLSGAVISAIDQAGHQVGRATSRTDGSYRLDVPGRGSYLVIASREAFEPAALTVVVGDGPSRTEITLGGVGGLRGVVRLDRDGGPVAEATVALADGRGEIVASAVTGLDGRFWFGDLSVASYTLAVNARRYQPVAKTVRVEGAEEVVCDVELTGNAVVSGVARAERDGRPLQDARVSLLDAAGELIAVTGTDADGSYEFDDVPAGDYTVVATGFPPTTSALTLGAGESRECDVELGHPDA